MKKKIKNDKPTSVLKMPWRSIEPVISTSNRGRSCQFFSYQKNIHDTLARIFREEGFFSNNANKTRKDCFQILKSNLPLIKWASCPDLPCDSSFFLLCNSIPNTCKFFFDMISLWLVPRKRLLPRLLFASDFKIPDINNEIYTVCELIIHFESQKDVLTARHNFPLIAKEIQLGACSAKQARQILEIKGLSGSQKTPLIQERINFFFHRHPKDIVYEHLLMAQQYFLVTRSDKFKEMRSSNHLTRIIFVHYLFRQSLLKTTKNLPDKHHVLCKTHREVLTLPKKRKNVLAILVGMNFLNKNESFDKEQLIKSISKILPQAKYVKQSFFTNVIGKEKISCFYVEIEKKDSSKFSLEEDKLLHKNLPQELKTTIKCSSNPLFMPVNEEEIVHNILNLSKQLKYIRDMPQVALSFENQTEKEISFLVVLVRILKPTSVPIDKIFYKKKTLLKYVHDRTRMVGYLRKKHPKEANVFRLFIKKNLFLRKDNSLDINKARKAIFQELVNIGGELRDFNGGMLSRERSLLTDLKTCFKKENLPYDEIFLENFFYSIKPDMMRCGILEPEPLKNWALLCNELLEMHEFKTRNQAHVIKQYTNYILALTGIEIATFKKNLPVIVKHVFEDPVFKDREKNIKGKKGNLKLDVAVMARFSREKMILASEKLIAAPCNHIYLSMNNNDVFLGRFFIQQLGCNQVTTLYEWCSTRIFILGKRCVPRDNNPKLCGKMIKIAPSILSGDFGKLADEAKRIENAGADYIHVDVMDGHFVPNLTIGSKAVAAINKAVTIPLDVHLMIYNPFDYIERFVESGAKILTIQFEATEEIFETLKYIRKCNVKAGLAFNPETSPSFIPKYLTECDMILLMSVNPGFGGQTFIKKTLEKIKYTRQMCTQLNIFAGGIVEKNKTKQKKLAPFDIEVDGGINKKTAKECILAGANVLVSGSYLFKTSNMKQVIKELRSLDVNKSSNASN